MSMKDGGPAFPWEDDSPHGKVIGRGMTLRDYFAGQALAGSLGVVVGAPSSAKDPKALQTVAVFCYAMADAMLAAREV
jgi:hypothetical protein